MKHSRPDYDRIQDPAGLIPKDEPVFILRAQDKIASGTVQFWADLAERNGAAPEMVAAARGQADAMETWGKKKVPDLPEQSPGPSSHSPGTGVSGAGVSPADLKPA